jgi:hypothetical protein
VFVKTVVVRLTLSDSSGSRLSRGGQLDQLWEPRFRRQQFARAMYSTLKFINVPLGFDRRTPYWAVTNRFNEIKYFVPKTKSLLKVSSPCGYPWCSPCMYKLRFVKTSPRSPTLLLCVINFHLFKLLECIVVKWWSCLWKCKLFCRSK